MFYPLAIFIGWRYTRAKRRNHFISFIALTSMLGIALGITVLITVLSVMNGFDQQIRKQIFAIAPEVTIVSNDQKLTDWQPLAQTVRSNPEIVQMTPFIAKEGLLSHQGQVQAAYVYGVDPSDYNKLIKISDKLVIGDWFALEPKAYRVILGEALANMLGVTLNDKVTIVSPQTTLSPVGLLPRFKVFSVAGIFKAGGGTDYDRGLAFVHLADAQTFFQMGHSISGLQLKLTDVYRAPLVTQQLNETLPNNLYAKNWSDDFGALFKALKLERTMMFIILSLIIAVAVFNLVSSLVMVVTDKRSDIAILRTIGADKRLIKYIFMAQGLLIGVCGTFLGIIGGILLSANVTHIATFLENMFSVKFVSENFYFLDYLPSDLHWMDVLKIASASLIMSLIATIYPAKRAAQIDPAEALRYE